MAIFSGPLETASESLTRGSDGAAAGDDVRQQGRGGRPVPAGLGARRGLVADQVTLPGLGHNAHVEDPAAVLALTA